MVRLTVLVAIAASQLFAFASTASAQVSDRPVAAEYSSAAQSPRERQVDPPRRGHLTRQPIRDSIATLEFGRVAAQAAPTGQKRSVGRKVLGGALGAAGGFFGGGYLGAAIEGDRCNCDDPGLKGALIGAPVGAVIGGILGALFF